MSVAVKPQENYSCGALTLHSDLKMLWSWSRDVLAQASKDFQGELGFVEDMKSFTTS